MSSPSRGQPAPASRSAASSSNGNPRPPRPANSVDCPEHPYTNACLQFPREYYDYEKFTIEWSSPDPYLLSRKIGRGKYSEVFTATNRVINRPCVVKMLKPVKEKRLAREVLILQNLCGVPNVISLYDMVMDEETGTPALVFESVNNMDHKELYPTFTDIDVRYYMYELLRTLDLVHALGIVHRDVKPQNICIDHKQKKLRLIDWGLAEFYLPDQTYNVRVASRYYKGPELLVGFRQYHYTLDIWSVGCMLAAIVFKREPFFHGQSNEDMLDQIAKVTGTQEIVEYVQALGLPVTNVPESYYSKPVPRRKLETFASSKTPLVSPEVIDLLERMFTVDHRRRITARDSLAHRYFDPVRHFFPPPGVYEPTNVAAQRGGPPSPERDV
jgi:casein kinase II subunit alpha